MTFSLPPFETLTRCAPETHIFDQRCWPRYAKWWAVELRFYRPLRRREVRAIVQAIPEGHVGVDGAVWGRWWNSWPGRDDDALLLQVVRRLRIPAVVRAAPYGRDCSEPELCRVGSSFSCDPVFTPNDWILLG